MSNEIKAGVRTATLDAAWEEWHEQGAQYAAREGGGQDVSKDVTGVLSAVTPEPQG